MNQRILFILTSHDRKGDAPSGYYLSEVSHPYYILRDAGYQIDFASPKGGKTHVDGLDLSDSDNAAFWNDAALRAQTENTLAPADINADDYAAIYYAGGHATMWDLPHSPALDAIAARIYDNGGVVAAVCHGPAALVDAKLSNGEYLVSGKNVAAFTNAEEEATGGAKIVPFLLETALVEHGAKHHAAPNWAENVVVDGRLITGQNPASAKGVGVALAKALG